MNFIQILELVLNFVKPLIFYEYIPGTTDF